MSVSTEEVQACPACGCELGEGVTVTRETGEEETVCGSCTFDCEDCGGTFHLSDDRGDSARSLCSSCRADYDECADCGSLHRTEDCLTLSGGDSICPRCYNRHYFTCSACDEIVDSNLYSRDGMCEHCAGSCDETTEDCDCCDCRQARANAQSCAILPYGSQPRGGLRFFSTDSERALASRTGAIFQYGGIELECESGGKHAPETVAQSALTAAGGTAYACHDGSLTNGFELISHPCTLSYWQAALSPAGAFESALAAIRAAGYKSHYTQTCGLHVHVSRAALSALTVWKATEFCRANIGLILRVSRRAESRLRQWASPDCEETPTELASKLKDCGGRYAESDRRYSALNITRNTVECRIFRGTLKRETVLGAIEWTFALYAYCAQSSLRDFRDPDALDLFIARNSALFPTAARSPFYCGARADRRTRRTA